MSARSYLSIGDVLTLLRHEFPDVTISKIRFLESQGLVNPERTPSGYRKFYEHDVERLRWVLRQQRENFLPLKVIKDRLDDEHAPDGIDITDLHAAAPKEAPADAEPVLVGQRSTASGRLSAGSAGSAGPQAGVPAGDAGSAAHDEGGSGTLHPEGSTLPGIEPVAVEANGRSTPGASASGGATSASTAHRMPASPPAVTRRSPGSADHRVTDPPSPSPDAVASGRSRSAGAGSRRDRLSEPASTGSGKGAEETEVVAGSTSSTGSTGVRPPPESSPPPSRPGGPGGRSPAATVPSPAVTRGSGTSLSMEELAAASGLEVSVLEALVEYGLLVETKVGGLPCFGDEGLAVATLAAGFARFGVEPRHLRLYKNAADREAGFVEQIVLPLVRQRNPEARIRAGEMADELARLGQQLRASLLRSALGDLLNG